MPCVAEGGADSGGWRRLAVGDARVEEGGGGFCGGDQRCACAVGWVVGVACTFGE